MSFQTWLYFFSRTDILKHFSPYNKSKLGSISFCTTYLMLNPRFLPLNQWFGSKKGIFKVYWTAKMQRESFDKSEVICFLDQCGQFCQRNQFKLTESWSKDTDISFDCLNLAESFSVRILFSRVSLRTALACSSTTPMHTKLKLIYASDVQSCLYPAEFSSDLN